MRRVKIGNISQRIHSSENLTHVFFLDSSGKTRFGRKIPSDAPLKQLAILYQAAEGLEHIIVPDGISPLPEGGFCLSIDWNGSSSPAQGIHMREIIQPLASLQTAGLSHLSIDRHSFIKDCEGLIKLVFWGDGLLGLGRNQAPELVSGGIPGIISDLFAAAKCSLESSWLKDIREQKAASELCSKNYEVRCSAAEKAGVLCGKPAFRPQTLLSDDLTFITSGSWQARDREINSAVCLAAERGWACRVLRHSVTDQGRPLPGVAEGTVTTSPEQLIRNTFGSKGGIEKLLVISEVSSDQPDLTAIIRKLHILSPPGLHIIVTGQSVPDTVPGKVLKLAGKGETALDVPLQMADMTLNHKIVTSENGPVARIPETSIPDNVERSLSGETLFLEGGWRWIAANPDLFTGEQVAESLFRLGRYREALDSVPSDCTTLKAEILAGMGRFSDSLELLNSSSDPLLVSRVYTGLGEIGEALKTLEMANSSAFLTELANLYDLSGKAAAGISLLENGLKNASGTEKVGLLCSLRNLEMRLGLIHKALEHAEEAVLISRQTSDVESLIKSLQARGRTLQVTGKWKEAQSDFQTAVLLSDENVVSMERPAEIDLLDIEIRMGRIAEAAIIFENLARKLLNGGELGKQMLLMLKANLGCYLGCGKKALPHALKAEEMASEMGLELYSGLSTLYAGKLNIQAGNSRRGIELLNKAMSTGHILGDKHLVWLAEIELLLNSESVEKTAEGRLPDYDQFPEENLIVRVILNDQRQDSLSALLDLPSPFVACRLADRYGMPEDRLLRNRLQKARDGILSQMSEEIKSDYLSTFITPWNDSEDPASALRNSLDLIRKQALWIADYCEGTVGLETLENILELDRISTEEFSGSEEVSHTWPLYISGNESNLTAEFLLPAAAVIASLPSPELQPNSSKKSLSRLVGDSEEMNRIRNAIERFAPEDIPVLITGETGTGKEVCALEIHDRSKRKNGRFVPVDCGAIPENLMESELFGAAAGAYTGISASRTGLLEEAAGGTLFLDEIGNLPLLMQVKLLRALDSGTFRRLGETRERKTDVRIIAATNSTLEKLMNQGIFRSDLYYRISAVRLHLPPLRDRFSDLKALAAHFAEKPLSPGALKLLMGYSWPGNVRELRNVIKLAAITAEEAVIRKCDITLAIEGDKADGAVTLRDAIRVHVTETVNRCNGNRAMAARVLQCDPKTLRKYLNS